MTHPELTRLADVLEAKDREIAELRDALDWYAESANWRRKTVGRNWTRSSVAFDRGTRAKLTLMMLENKK